MMEAMGIQPRSHAYCGLLLIYLLHDTANVRTDPHLHAHARLRTLCSQEHIHTLSHMHVPLHRMFTDAGEKGDKFGSVWARRRAAERHLRRTCPLPCACAALVRVGRCSCAWGAWGCVCFEVQVVSKSPEARQEALQTLLTRCIECVFTSALTCPTALRQAVCWLCVCVGVCVCVSE